MNRKVIHTVTNYTEQFGLDIAKNSIVYCELDGNTFLIPIDSIPTDTLDTVTRYPIGNKTGDMFDYLGTNAPVGWIRMNNTSIGNPSSGATQRANEDCHKLFVQLLNSYSDTVFAVLPGGRGASAAADWSANKRMTIRTVNGTTLTGTNRAIKIIKL